MTTDIARTWALAAVSIALYMAVVFVAAVVATHPDDVAAWAEEYAGLILGITSASLWSAYIGGRIARAHARATPKTPVTTHVYRWEAGRITGVVGDEPEIDPMAKAALEILLNGHDTETAQQADSAAMIKVMADAADACVGAMSNSDPTIMRAYAGDALQLLADALPRDKVIPTGCDPGRLPVVRLTRAITSAHDELRRLKSRYAVAMPPEAMDDAITVLTRAVGKQQTQPAAAEPSPATVGGAGG